MNEDREKYILEQLLKHKKVTVKDLAKELFVSEPSIRRDLAALERKNLIHRVHGGAVIEETALSKNKIPFAIREMEDSSSKLLIAEKAAALVKDNDVIFLDASTSVYHMIPFLALKNNITVVTNGVKALAALAEYGIRTISTGGELVSSCFALVGEEAYKTIDSFNADITFFSCRGLSEDGFLTDIAPDENYVRIRMIRHSKKAYLLCSENKIGKKFYHNLCHRDDIDGVLTGTENMAIAH